MVVILRRALLFAVLFSALAAGKASASVSVVGGFTPPALKGTPQFIVSGHGWGHGVGMSQYGAYGYAQNGFTFDRILAHYYPGTELTSTTIKSVRVLLADTTSVTISSTGPWKVKDAGVAATTLPAGKVTVDPKLTFKVPGNAQPQEFTGPVTFTTSSASAPLVFKTKTYRGTFTVASDGKKVTLVDTLPLEQYVDAVVPSEMPYSWSTDALEAQAVATRSYALAMRKTNGAFDVYPDTRSQMYGGAAAEKPTTNAAVDATAGKVLTYNGKIATTYFFSTSGGRTASIADAWGAKPVPYLVSVPDPYDSISPYHDWGPYVFTAAKLQKLLKSPGRLLDVQTDVNGSGRVSQLTAVGEKGDSDLTGDQVRAALGLRSTWFAVGVLALDPLATTPVVYGTATTLSGLGRNLAKAQLEQRAEGTTTWKPGPVIDAAADGSFAMPTQASMPMEYRAVSGNVTTPPTTLAVAPWVRLRIASDWSAYGGSVQPKLPGAAVQIQQVSSAGRWTTIAKTTVTGSGGFNLPANVTPGVYRARVLPGHGWSIGLSPKLDAR